MFSSDPNFQAIANLVSDLLWCNDRQGNIWYNQRWLEYTGQRLAEDCKHGWLDAIHPSDRTQSSIDFQNALAEGGFLQQELRLRAASGEYRWFALRVESQRNEKGRITHWFGAATDIHDRRIARKQLQGSEELLPKIIEHLPVGAVFVVDRHLRYLLAEGEALYSAGFKPEDLVGRTIYEVIPPELIPEHEELYEIGFGGESFTREHNAYDSTYVSRGTPLRDANGEVYAVLAVSYDITERKRAEEELRLAAELNAFRVILSDALRSQSDPVKIQEEAARVLGEHLQVDRVTYGEVEGKTEETFIVHRDYCRAEIPNAAGRHRFDVYGEYVTQKLRDGVTLKVTDVKAMSEHTEAHLAAYEALRIRAYIAVPLVKENRIAAYLEVDRIKPWEWTPQEVALVEETAERTWAAVERNRTEAALQKSEAKYSALFNSIDEGFCIVEVLFDADGIPFDHRILQANPTFEKHSGISNPEGKTASELAPGIEQYWNDLYAQVIRTGEAIRTEIHSEALNRWFEVLVSRIDEARMSQVAIVFTNITERKRREQHQVMLLEVSQELVSLDNIAETMNSLGKKIGQYFGVNQCVFSELSEDFEILMANYGWNVEGSPSPMGTYRTRDFLTDEQIEAQMAGEVSIVNDTQTDPRVSADYSALGIRSFVIVPLVRNNCRFMLSLIDDKPRQWREDEVNLMQEITNRIWTRLERVRAEAAIRESELQRVREQSAREEEQQRAETLAELDRAKTQFFSNVSHEFRTPLTLLLAPLRDALEDLNHPLPNPHRQRLDLARRNGLRLFKLVNTLLDFSRVEEGRLQANYEPTDLASYTVELASTFRSAIENEELQLAVDCPPLPEPIYVDRQMWSKIVSNLLSNAFKFTFTGIISISLKLIATETSENMQANRAELTVSDTGTGIPAEELPHIFERFYQSKGTKGRSYEGSGIGLSLVQELVKLHDGEITVSSEVDRGTTFRVTLPTGSAHLPPEHLENASMPSSTAMPSSLFVSEAEHWLSEESIGSQNLESNAQRILIVDDNGDLRNYLQRLLSQHYQVETANDGLAALTAIRQATQSYDLVLADIMMPVMDGLELLRSLRADPDTEDIPIILLSARAEEESEIIGLEAGADDYLFKPFSAKELLARVKSNLELTQMRREVTYRKQVTQEIQALNKTLEYRVQERTAQLKAINQELEAFSYSVSHDLQTPLRYISSFGEKLQAKLKFTQIDSIGQRYLKIMVESAERSQEMVQNLLEFSRLEQTQMQPTPISMEQLVQQVRQQLQPQLEGRSLKWQIESLPEVRGDREMLRLVWQNLLSNAVKYTRDRTPAKITVGSFQRDGETIFFVRDNGVGFDMKYRDRLFTLFQRLHSQEFPGTGVGLAHVRRIIHRHGGQIWVESAIDRGATFQFTVNREQGTVNREQGTGNREQ